MAQYKLALTFLIRRGDRRATPPLPGHRAKRLFRIANLPRIHGAVTLHWLANPEAVVALKELVATNSDSANAEVGKMVALSRRYLADPASQWEYFDADWT